MTHSGIPEGPAALALGHLGHELPVLEWAGRTRPVVFVLTDGSGRSGQPRIETSRKILQGLGATTGAIFGRFNDQQVYQALLAREVSVFSNWLMSWRKSWQRLVYGTWWAMLRRATTPPTTFGGW